MHVRQAKDLADLAKITMLKVYMWHQPPLDRQADTRFTQLLVHLSSKAPIIPKPTSKVQSINYYQSCKYREKYIVEVQRKRNRKSADTFKPVVRLSQWASPMVLWGLFGGRRHEGGQCVCNTVPLCPPPESQTSGRTPEHHHYWLAHGWVTKWWNV